MKGYKNDRKKRIEKKAGASLAIVMIILTLFTAFSLTLMQGAGQMLAQANRRIEQERCYQLAQSFAKVLEKELTKYNDQDDNSGIPEKSFYSYAYKFLIGIYGEYDPAHPEFTTYHYTAAIDDANVDTYGTVRVVLRKESNQEENTELSGWTQIGTHQQIDSIMEKSFLRYIFTVDVIVTLDDVSYTYQTEYRSEERYAVKYKTNDEQALFYDGSNFHIGTSGGAIYEGLRENIWYSYDIDNVTHCIFKNSYSEEGV